LQIGKAFEEKERDWLAKDLGLDKDNKDDLKQHFVMQITKIGFVEKRSLDEAFFKEAIPRKRNHNRRSIQRRDKNTNRGILETPGTTYVRA